MRARSWLGRRGATVALLGGLAAALAGCGDDSGDSATADGSGADAAVGDGAADGGVDGGVDGVGSSDGAATDSSDTGGGGGGTADTSADASGEGLPFSPAFLAPLGTAVEGVLAETGAPGVAVAVASPDALWSNAWGRRGPNEGDAPLNPSARLRLGSVSMAFAGATALALVDAGDLALTDSLDKWLPELPNAGDIEIRHLLAHTSGLPNYLDDAAFAGDLEQAHSPEELLAVAAAGEAAFAPGAQAELNPTNTVALAYVVGQVTGAPYLDALDRRVLVPLGAVQTFLEGNEVVPGGVTPGYTEVDSEWVDVTSLVHPSNTWAAGAMASTAAETVSLAREFWGADALSANLRDTALTPVALTGGADSSFGLGCLVEELEGSRLVRHPGAAPGYSAELVYDEATDLAIAVLANADTGEPARAVADALVALLRQGAATQ